MILLAAFNFPQDLVAWYSEPHGVVYIHPFSLSLSLFVFDLSLKVHLVIWFSWVLQCSFTIHISVLLVTSQGIVKEGCKDV